MVPMKKWPTSAEVGAALRVVRGQRGESVATVARRVSMHPEWLRLIEVGKAKPEPSINTLNRLAKAYGTDLVTVANDAIRPPGPVMSAEEIAKAIIALPTPPGISKFLVMQRALVLSAYAASDYNESAAARLLGMERKAYARRLRRARRQA